jgi:hypothetical protein
MLCIAFTMCFMVESPNLDITYLFLLILLQGCLAAIARIKVTMIHFGIAVDLVIETVWTRNGTASCDAYGISNSTANFVAFQLYCSCFVLDRVEPP